MATYFTSDHHFSHGNILRFVPARQIWADVEEMNEGLIERWNATVGPDDTVISLGDMIMGHGETTLALMPRLNGHKHIVAGNHDRIWAPGAKPGYVERWMPLYDAAGLTVMSTHTPVYFVLAGRPVLLSHLPYDFDERHGAKYAGLHPEDDGKTWLIHGHVHDLWQVRGRQINVGVDVWDFAPVHEDRLVAIMNQAD